MNSICIIKPCFNGDRYQVIRVCGYHSSPIAWANTLAEAKQIQKRYQEAERNY